VAVFTGSLVVTEISSTGVETVRSLTTHYTVTGGTSSTGLPSTGTVASVSSVASGTSWRVTRSTSKTQGSTWAENDPFPQAVVEAALDRLTLIAQESISGGGSGITGTPLLLDTSGATDVWAAQGYRLRNLADGTDDTDAATVGQLNAATGVDQAAAAAASAAAAAASFDSFDDRYLGAKAANPTLDNDGNALQTGAMYWNTGSNELRIYNGSSWQAYSPTAGVSSVNSRNGSVTLVSTDLTMTNTSRVVGRKSASGGASEEMTLSEVLDFVGSAAQGDLLYRGASTWTRLGAGTSGQFLKTLGAGANPAWDSPAYSPGGTDVALADGGTGASLSDPNADRIMFWDDSAGAVTWLTAGSGLSISGTTMTATGGLTLLNSGTVSSAATLDIVLTSYTSYRGLVVLLSNFLPATDGVQFYLRFSTDGGSTYDASGYNYVILRSTDISAIASTGSGSASQIMVGTETGNQATEGLDARVEILSQTTTTRWGRVMFSAYQITEDATPAGRFVTGGGSREVAQDTDAIRFLFSSGNIASGSWAIYGYA
jgi:hypothetical protein